MACSLPSVELTAFSHLVDQIYSGATDASRWPSVLGQMVEWLGARKSLFFTPLHPPENGGFVFSHNLPESFIELWRTRYHAIDVWAKAAVERGIFMSGNVALGQTLVSSEDLLASDMYRDLNSKADIVHLLACAVYGLDAKWTPPVSCAFYRGYHDAQFEEAERAKLALLAPHLSRALGVMLRLRDAEFKVAASLSALDRLNAGVLLLDRNGHVAHANRSAMRILQEEDGLRLSAVANKPSLGRLVASRPDTQRALLSAMDSAISPDILTTAHFGSYLAVERISGRSLYALQFSSLPEQSDFGRGSDAPRAIVFLTDTAEPITVDGEMLRQVYGLTPAEVRVAKAMLRGGTVDESATELGVSRNTLMTQLKRIYEKTGVDSRARFVKLVLSLSTR